MASKWNPLEIMRMMLTVGQLLLMLMSSSSASQTVYSDCQETCGDVAVPYPFGIGKGCYLNDYFSIRCNVTDDAASTPTPYLRDSDTEVLDISLNGELRIYTYIGKDCYNEFGVQQQPHTSVFAVSPCSLSLTPRTSFMAIGCDTFAVIAPSRPRARPYHDRRTRPPRAARVARNSSVLPSLSRAPELKHVDSATVTNEVRGRLAQLALPVRHAAVTVARKPVEPSLPSPVASYITRARGLPGAPQHA
ncbi:hypothetical protein NL676_036593 [Syzygium grande]|nr:hypothetical protein NL676_036593 [Syzygium grande]